MCFKMDDFDIETFIEEVQTRPAIWDSNCSQYSDRQEKLKAWEGLVAVFDPDFDDKTIAEKNLYGKQLQKKWKCLRDCYTREVNRRRNGTSGPSKRRPYLFYKHLNFLKPVISKMTLNTEGDNKIREEPHQHPNPLIVRAAIKRRKKSMLRQQAEGVLQTGSVRSRILKSKVTQQRKCITKQKRETGNEDKLFMLSLVKDFKKIPEENKLDAKCAIIRVLKKYQVCDRRDSGSHGSFPMASYNRTDVFNQSQNVPLKNDSYISFPDGSLSFSPLPEFKIEQEQDSLADKISPVPSKGFSGLTVNNENSCDSEMYDRINE